MDVVFLDTNILIDFLGERKLYYEAAAKVLTLADNKKIKLYVSPISISTAYYVVFKFESKNKVLDKIRKIKILLHTANINDTSFEKAINSDFKDFEDAIQYYSALDSKCNIILTRNERDFKTSSIPAMSAENYLKLRTSS